MGDMQMSVVDPTWELLDPNPDIRALFLEFNDTFFWGQLSGVEVKWSARMTLCAGVCSYEGRGGLCSIRLSEPLLKLRPRKDLVETLLHEMIHALLFVTHNNKDHDSHGPEFCKHMERINGRTGANISVYHNFHDEVDEYRKHWWLCNGPCQKRKPYFGYVKRAMNRAPSSLDPWWADHQRTCGGSFVKVKEPENYPQKRKRKNDPTISEVNSSSHVKGKSNGVDIRTVIPFSGTGYKLFEPNKSDAPLKILNINPTKDKAAVPLLNHTPPSTNINGTFLTNKIGSAKSTPAQSILTKVSVANTKVFINLNGSPIKLPSGSKNKSHQISSKQKSVLPFFKMQKDNSFDLTLPSPSIQSTSQKPQKDISFGFTLPSQSFPSTSPGSNSENKEPLYKKLQMNDRESFIIHSGNKTNVNDNKSCTGPAATTASGLNHTIKVSCPVCGTEVLECKINDHLDTCTSSGPQKDILLDVSLPLQSFPSTSQGSNSAIKEPLYKKLQINDKDSFIIHSGNKTNVNDNKSCTRPAATTASGFNHTIKVCCPVCGTDVLQDKINDHLDTCLQNCNT
ncbi:DNA-dependent metalloprotease SPRTN [Xenopus laevis]|uniref:DNA-dependent metalloprotease SPRTN n=2 Tax=Xenopus laevis TaxID=8355 RepID=SPRTN_XENLA|nr:DNA-dependent metalloprotease SPRTN [Xenopus laevis]A0A1L8G2K9.1 RecName: Full=DNA-dependent metalloprotease SPRTN; AltName: Full=Protein with SprT-like domain at the N terminus; Short=Spartan [Xenopus laevis]OCT78037.1 hypothetical protein XELAEV_18029135mg [Xenopus laevis]